MCSSCTDLLQQLSFLLLQDVFHTLRQLGVSLVPFHLSVQSNNLIMKHISVKGHTEQHLQTGQWSSQYSLRCCASCLLLPGQMRLLILSQHHVPAQLTEIKVEMSFCGSENNILNADPPRVFGLAQNFCHSPTSSVKPDSLKEGFVVGDVVYVKHNIAHPKPRFRDIWWSQGLGLYHTCQEMQHSLVSRNSTL